MTKQQRTTAPIEDVLLFTAQHLTESAYERFTQGGVSHVELKVFYDVVRDWSRKSEEVLEAMNKLGIRDETA